MKTETRREQFEPPSVLGNLLRKLHIDIPLFIGLFLTSLLSFAILYSAGGQDMDILMRQAGRIGLAFLLMTALAHIDPYQFKRYSTILFGFGIFLLIAVYCVLCISRQPLDAVGATERNWPQAMGIGAVLGILLGMAALVRD